MYINQLKDLWIKTFGDSKEYVDSFFDNFYDEKHILTYVENEIVISALYMVPYDMIYEGRKYKVMYLYALATLEKYRGKGIMGSLIEKAHVFLDKNGFAASFLIPASDSLYDYYKKYGYSYLIKRKEIEISCKKAGIEYKVTEIKNIRNFKLTNFEKFNINRIILSDKQNDFMCVTYLKEGGKILYFEDLNGYVLFSKENDMAVIYSTNLIYQKILEISNVFYKEYGCKKLIIENSFESSEEFKEYNAGLFRINDKILLNGFNSEKVYVDRILM